MQISQPVLEVLSAATLSGSALILNGTLDRKLYTDTNKVLEAIGGKWNKKAKAHLFDGDVIEIVDPIILTGEYTRTKQDFGQFDSPPEVVGRVMELACIQSGHTVLEPSAGLGALAVAAHNRGGIVTALEIDQKRYQNLSALNFHDVGLVDDFLTVPVPKIGFDRVVMNPPFARQADLLHVRRAFEWLKPDGLLVAVMSAGTRFRQDRKAVEFRDWADSVGGIFEDLPDGSFKPSGTNVSTVTLTI